MNFPPQISHIFQTSFALRLSQATNRIIANANSGSESENNPSPFTLTSAVLKAKTLFEKKSKKEGASQDSIESGPGSGKASGDQSLRSSFFKPDHGPYRPKIWRHLRW
jgi:hypothetical protein